MSRAVQWAALAIAVAVIVASLRFLSVAGFANDHYMHLAAAQQITFGEWPSRDYVDFGMPLMEALSAVALWATPTAPLFGESVLIAAMFGLAAALTLYTAGRLTGSLWIAVLVVVLEVAIFPRTYSYPKVLAYSAGLVAMWRYADRQSMARIAQLALAVVCAFLLRYDHGIYVGVGALALVAAISMPAGVREVIRRSATYAAWVVTFLIPYLAFIAYYDGLWRHVMRGIDLQAIEGSRGRTIPEFTFRAGIISSNAVPWLFYVFHALPIAAAIVAWVRWRSLDVRERSMIVGLIVLAVLVDFGMIRDTLSARLPDAIVPAALLLGWLLASTLRLRQRPAGGLAWVAAILVAVVTTASATVVGATKEQLDRAELLSGPSRLLGQFQSRVSELHERFPLGQMPSRVAYTLLPFFKYVDRCLGPDDHILMPAYLPEVGVWARRPFAGGQIWFQPGVLASDDDHRLVMSRLQSQRVPVTVMHPSSDLIAAQFDDLARYLHDRFPTITPVQTDDGRVLRIGFDPALAVKNDAETGWPCYR